MNSFLLAAGTLFQREVVRFLRQRNRIIGALGTPIVFWFLIGSGLGRSFRSPEGGILFGRGGLTYLQYFFPGTVVLILLFTAIFSTISIIEDRREGFLQGVLVSPAPRAAVVLGKMFGGAVLAFGQAMLFLAVVPFLKIPLSFSGFLSVAMELFLLAFALTGLGFILAWRMDSTQGFHAIMNLFLMPLWFLSGALFPAAGAPTWLQFVMRLNPLSYGVSALHQNLFDLPMTRAGIASPAVCFGVTVFFAAAMFGLALRMAGGREK